MRQYIVLNNKNSLEITGLFISKLPPITKPAIRYNITEIDGRDGDLVSKLGYSAYDKELEISILSDCNLNEIISFFDSEGIVTFSDEPTKYYRYKILEQIDFEKLIKFRTATVTFHVQPFKYSAIDERTEYTITNEQEINITNNGNISSKPIITLYGSGTINLSLNGIQLFVIELDGSIVLNIEEMNAYKDNILANRSVIGNYDTFSLQPGKNTISWTGTITKLSFENYSRWI